MSEETYRVTITIKNIPDSKYDEVMEQIDMYDVAKKYGLVIDFGVGEPE